MSLGQPQLAGDHQRLHRKRVPVRAQHRQWHPVPLEHFVKAQRASRSLEFGIEQAFQGLGR